jgi:hypothetical protein
MMIAASRRSQSRNTMRFTEVGCMFWAADPSRVKMRENSERLLPLHINKLIRRRLAEIHRHGGFRPSNREEAPRFFSGLGAHVFGIWNACVLGEETSL